MAIDRQQLTQIIKTNKKANWWNPDLFEQKVRPCLPVELEVVSVPPKHEQNYNCFVFIFGLKDDLEFLGVSQSSIIWYNMVQYKYDTLLYTSFFVVLRC